MYCLKEATVSFYRNINMECNIVYWNYGILSQNQNSLFPFGVEILLKLDHSEGIRNWFCVVVVVVVVAVILAILPQ